jgi:hypothetical protein
VTQEAQQLAACARPPKYGLEWHGNQLGSVPIGSVQNSLNAAHLLIPITGATGNTWKLAYVD